MFILIAAIAAAPSLQDLSTNACPANTTNRQTISPKIIVQGGTHPDANPTGQLTIGPKQDDPAQPKPSAAGGTSLLAIGPKQDDPAQPKPSAAGGTSLLAIGPKQDDPAQPGRGGAASMKSDCGLTPAPVPAR